MILRVVGNECILLVGMIRVVILTVNIMMLIVLVLDMNYFFYSIIKTILFERPKIDLKDIYSHL